MFRRGVVIKCNKGKRPNYKENPSCFVGKIQGFCPKCVVPQYISKIEAPEEDDLVRRRRNKSSRWVCVLPVGGARQCLKSWHGKAAMSSCVHML